MSNVKLNFFPKDSVGKNPGDYEMFIDLDSSAGPSTMVLEAPTGWATVALKLYQVIRNPVGKIMPNVPKNTDTASLASGTDASYQAVFNGAALPAGFLFDPVTSTLFSTGQINELFEFLVWIQDGSGDNDYLDPGIRNHD